MLSGKRTERGKLVPEQFIQRWADRFHEIRVKHGEVRARAWARGFLNAEDVDRVMMELTRRSRGGK